MIGFILIATVVGAVYISMNYPSPEILDVYQAEVVLVYNVGGPHTNNHRCELRLPTGFVVNSSCMSTSKKGDKVTVNKVKKQDIEYIIQYQNKSGHKINPVNRKSRGQPA